MFLTWAVSGALALLAIAPREVTATTNDSIPAVLSTTPQLSGLSSLVGEIADFLGELQNLSDVTVFAPSNAALAAATANNPSLSSSLSDRDFLAALLRYHVLYSTVPAADMSTTPRFAHTLLNDTRFSNVTGGQVVELQRRGADLIVTSGLRATANVIASDIPLPNGILHIIDAVLTIPPPLPKTALDANLTSFGGALAASNLAADLAPLLDLTVFAPSNAAFAAVAAATAPLTAAQLHALLAYHVVPNSQGYSPLLTNTTDVQTLADAPLDLLITPAGAVFVGAARVVLADVLVAQGVLHVIDAVLDPEATGAAAVPDSSATTAAVLLTKTMTGGSTASALWFTSGQPVPTTINSAFSMTTARVVAGYSTAPTQNPALATPSSTSRSSSAMAAQATGLAGWHGGGIGVAAAAAAVLLVA